MTPSIKEQIKSAKSKQDKLAIFNQAVKECRFASPKTIRKWERLVA